MHSGTVKRSSKMFGKFLIFVCAVGVLSSQCDAAANPDRKYEGNEIYGEEKKPEQNQQQKIEHSERVGKFMNLKKLYTSVETNEIDVEKKEETENPDTALTGIYSECVLTFSLPCLQKKFLVFLDRLGRMDSFNLLGDFLSVKRTTKETTKPITEKAIEARMNYHKSEEDLGILVDYAIERFFNSHKLRIKLPFGLSVTDSATGRSSSPESNAIDIGFARGFSEGRGKKKKMMMMMMMMLKMKLMAVLPIVAMLIKLKALKALILSKMALFLTLLSLLKKKMMKDDKHKIVIIHDPHHGGGGGHHDGYGPSSGGGGGGWSSGGDSYSSGGGDHGGGWGRSWSPSDAQELAYRGQNVTTST